MSINPLKVGIITPTYNRPDLLKRAVNSITNQSHQNWILVIIDDCSTTSYNHLEEINNDDRVIYIKNPENKGVNYSRNIGLSLLENFNCDFITFLDDDGYFVNNNILEYALNDIQESPNTKWFIFDLVNEKDNLSNNESCGKIDYILDYLYGNKLNGDTHNFLSSEITKNKRFSTFIKNGQEWTYWIKFSDYETKHIGRKIQYHIYQDDGLTKKRQNRDLKLVLINIYFHIMVFYKRPRCVKALKKSIQNILQLPFRLIKIIFLK